MFDEQRQLQLEAWFGGYPDKGNRDATSHYEELTDNLIRRVGAARYEEEICRLYADLPRCPAKCQEQFREWAAKWIARRSTEVQLKKHLPTVVPYILAPDIAKKKQRKGQRPFVYEQRGGNCYVTLTHRDKPYVWSFPATWLSMAERLWPVHLRPMPDGRLAVSRKTPVEIDGRKIQAIQLLHRTFMNLPVIPHDAEDRWRVTAVNNNWLDFCNDNLRLCKAGDLFDRARVSLANLEGFV